MSPRTSALPAVGLTVLLVLAGCAGFAGPLDDGQQQQVADRLADRLQQLDSFEATVSTQIQTGDRSMTTETEMAVDLTTGEYRMQILAPNRSAGDLTVYNGSTMVSYDASENVYRTYDVEMDGPATGSNLSAQFDRLAEETDIVYNGTETVDGTETYKATLVPTNESAEFVDRVTLWVETDRMVPVKMQLETGSMANVTTTVTFSDVKLNPDFEPGTFEFDAPRGASHEDSTVQTETETYESRDELAGAVDLRVPPAELPDGFAFQEGMVATGQDGHVRTAMLDYSDGNRDLTVSLSAASDGMTVGMDGDEQVTVDGHDATYRSVGDSTGNVVWSCNGTQYVVFGNLEKSTLLSVAEGIGC